MTKEEQRQERQEVDPQKIEQFISKVINNLGATSNVALAFIEDKLDLYKAMAEANKSASGSGKTSKELARLTNTNERYIREWLAEQVCGGYIIYDSIDMKVSWHVTGIRKDPWANAHRIQVEEDKQDKERGHYMYPDLYGQL